MSETGMYVIGFTLASFVAGLIIGVLVSRDFWRSENYWRADQAERTLKKYLEFQEYKRTHEKATHKD